MNINKSHPITEQIKLNYMVEYTDELERDPDFENIKQLPRITDLETAISRMFRLRKQGKHNISIGYEILDKNTNKLILDDFAYELEDYTDSTQEDKLKDKIHNQDQTITELAQEVDLLKAFLNKYNAMNKFYEFKQEQKHITV